MGRRLRFLVLGLAVAAITAPVASGGLVDRNERIGGISYRGWATSWMKAAMERSLDSPKALFADRDGRCGFRSARDSRVWFLPGSVDGPMETRCAIPRGTYLAFYTAAYGYVTTNGTEAKILPQVVEAFWSGSRPRPTLTVDGAAEQPGRVLRTPVFSANYVGGGVWGPGLGPVAAVWKTSFVILRPLRPGRHVIEADYGLPDEWFAATYTLTVR
jgi:hypothetical protein